MREPELPGEPPYLVLCVAGTDSAGCSGIAADLRTVAALGGHAQIAVTAVTAQDTCGVRAASAVSPRLVRAQIAAALEDAGAAAVKIGMLAGAPTVRAVAAALAERGRARVVLDPVLRSSTGRALLDEAGRRALLARLLPLVDLLTPNIPEAEALLQRRIRGLAGMKAAARELCGRGAGAVLLKGGHRRGAAATDVFSGAGETLLLSAPWVDSADTRGTGCVLSTACACFLAQGASLPEAVRRAKDVVSAAILHGYRIGRGPGPVDPFAGRTRAGETP
jgi:hydroxymethylpyrimidine/phosphomethylpyrimidine kinase